MENARKKELLAEILDVEPDEIEENMELRKVGDWDSLAILSFIVMMAEEYDKEVSGDAVKSLVTVSDAFALME